MHSGMRLFSNLIFVANRQSQYCRDGIYIVTKRWAGHSKWSNIKHSKSLRDYNKSILFQKVTQKISLAVKEGGENPEINSKLKACIEEARKLSVPNSTIQNAIQKAKTSTLEKPYWLIYGRPDGLTVAFEVASSNKKLTISRINQYAKRLDLKQAKSVNDLAAEKGVILCEHKHCDYDKALEDGITVGVDEVEQGDDNTFIFVCNPSHLDRIVKEISNIGYEVHSATCELEFFKQAKINKEEDSAINQMNEKLNAQFIEILRTVDNAERC